MCYTPGVDVAVEKYYNPPNRRAPPHTRAGPWYKGTPTGQKRPSKWKPTPILTTERVGILENFDEGTHFSAENWRKNKDTCIEIFF